VADAALYLCEDGIEGVGTVKISSSEMKDVEFLLFQ